MFLLWRNYRSIGLSTPAIGGGGKLGLPRLVELGLLRLFETSLIFVRGCPAFFSGEGVQYKKLGN